MQERESDRKTSPTWLFCEVFREEAQEPARSLPISSCTRPWTHLGRQEKTEVKHNSIDDLKHQSGAFCSQGLLEGTRSKRRTSHPKPKQTESQQLHPWALQMHQMGLIPTAFLFSHFLSDESVQKVGKSRVGNPTGDSSQIQALLCRVTES